MTTQHTPGPWKVKQSQGATLRLFGGPQIQAGRRTVAWPEFPSVDENDISEANARLIAAAPDLLAALRQTWDIIERFANEGKPGFLEMYTSPGAESARAAIAKAEGNE